jgi:hypothetical protein
MTPSSTKVIVAHVGHVTGAEAADVASAKTSDVTAAKSTHVASTEATHVTSAKAAAHVAASATAAVAASAATAAAAGLCTGGNKAAGKQSTCQNHHRSSSHNILQLVGRTFRLRALPDVGAFKQTPTSR